MFRIVTLPLLLVTSLAQAEVQLVLDGDVKLHVVNGEAWSGPGIFDERDPIVLADGVTQLVVNVVAELGRSRTDTVIERSEAFVLRFQAEDTTLELGVPEIRSRDELRAFNEKPSWSLRDQQGNAVDFQWAVLEKSGFQLVRDYEKEIDKFNRNSDSAAAIKTRKPLDISYPSPPPSISDGDVAEDQTVVRQMLRYWYSKADKNTKSEMKRWIQSGE